MNATKIPTEKSEKASSNTIKYQLSNNQYIKLGWTIIPTTKLARRIFLYETKIAKPNMNTPKLLMGTKYYSNNKSPFIVQQDNSKTIFYPDGEIAIEVKKPVEKNYNVIMVFRSLPSNEIGVNSDRHKMIAAFDTLGNGLILNEDDEIRLTFNQIGGICFDKHVALVPFTWTWSQCVANPKMEAVYIEPAATRFEKVLEQNVGLTFKSPSSKNVKETSEGSQMKFLKEDAASLLPHQHIIPKYEKLLPMRAICLKINNFISLRILDRRNINLKYFAGNKNFRVELGFDVLFDKPVKSFLDDPSWGTRGFLRCRFEDEFVCDWINSKKNIFKSLQEDEKGDDK